MIISNKKFKTQAILNTNIISRPQVLRFTRRMPNTLHKVTHNDDLLQQKDIEKNQPREKALV